MAFDATYYTSWATEVAANDDLRARIWQSRVRKDARSKNCLREMIGGEDSMSPIVEVTDLKKGPGDVVVMNTIAPERGQGTLGENQLTVRTGKIHAGSFSITIDFLRHAVSWTKKFEKMTQAGRAKDEITSDLMADWLSRKEEDDFQWVLIRTARLVDTENLLFVNGRASLDELETTDTVTTTAIEDTKGLLISQGAKEMSIDKDVTGADIAKFMFFGPGPNMRSLRTSTAFQAALKEADSRGPTNRLFTGKYGLWENMVVYPHEIKLDPAAGRQGSPMFPMARLGVALANGTPTEINGGGGSVAPNDPLGDFFANFPGYLWKITDGETPPADSGTHYAMIYNVSGANKDDYEIISYTTGNNGQALTSVTRGSATETGGVAGGGNVTAEAAGRFNLAHPVGSLIFPCTKNGVPFGYCVGLGAEALGYAKGCYDAVPIEEGEDFHPVGKPSESFLKSFGMMSVRGIEPWQNTVNKYPNFAVLTCATKIPGIVGPEAYAA